MYKEFLTYTATKDLQDEVSDYCAFQIEFNGDKTARIILHNQDGDIGDLTKNVAVELKRQDAIDIARAILFSLNEQK